MPIVELCQANSAGAVKHVQQNYYTAEDVVKYGYSSQDLVYYTREVHHGVCLFESEHNGYDDSDFYMTIWDDEFGRPQKIMFASTRGWTYPCLGSRVDATPEVIAKYENWKKVQSAIKAYEQRKVLILKNRANRTIALSAAAKWGFKYGRLLKIKKKLIDTQYESILSLFNLKIRSGFKKSLQSQVINWLKEETPKYDLPLSPKQMAALHNIYLQSIQPSRKYGW